MNIGNNIYNMYNHINQYGDISKSMLPFTFFGFTIHNGEQEKPGSWWTPSKLDGNQHEFNHLLNRHRIDKWWLEVELFYAVMAMATSSKWLVISMGWEPFYFYGVIYLLVLITDSHGHNYGVNYMWFSLGEGLIWMPSLLKVQQICCRCPARSWWDVEARSK